MDPTTRSMKSHRQRNSYSLLAPHEVKLFPEGSEEYINLQAGSFYVEDLNFTLLKRWDFSKHQFSKAKPICRICSITTMKALAKRISSNSAIAKLFALAIALNVQDKVISLSYLRHCVLFILLTWTTSHPGGWDPKTGVFFKEINEQIDQAFANINLNLKDTGGKS